jgi:hypothetical protein
LLFKAADGCGTGGHFALRLHCTSRYRAARLIRGAITNGKADCDPWQRVHYPAVKVKK